MTDKKPKFHKHIHIERTPERLFIRVLSPSGTVEMIHLVLSAIGAFIFWSFLCFASFWVEISFYVLVLGYFPFFFFVKAFLMPEMQAIRLPPSVRHELNISPTKTTLCVSTGRSQTITKTIQGVQLRDYGERVENVPRLTLWLTFEGDGLPAIPSLTQEEGDYLVTIITNFLQGDEALFYADDPPNSEGKFHEKR